VGSVGLLYVGAVLFINGIMLLGWLDAKAAAPMNIFVGGLQVFTPTYLIVTANGNADTILAASGLYLFGFTYLYVAFNLLAGLDGTGLGYFSLFVAICALIFSYLNFNRFHDNSFGVIWLYWAFLWTLFFLLLGRRVESLGRYTGAVTAIEGWVTGAIPAFLLLTGNWGKHDTATAIALAIFGVVVFAALYPVLGRRRPGPASSSPPQSDRSTSPATG
jgi:putative amide transporter protein